MMVFWIWVAALAYIVIGYFVAKFHTNHFKHAASNVMGVFWWTWIAWPLVAIVVAIRELWYFINRQLAGLNPFEWVVEKSTPFKKTDVAKRGTHVASSEKWERKN